MSSLHLTLRFLLFCWTYTDAALQQGSGNLDYIQIIKKPGGSLRESYLEEGFILDKTIGVGQVTPTVLYMYTMYYACKQLL
jgi:chaperonin GroEL (HSP60 family)